MLEEGQEEWGKERVMGEQGGGETRQKEKGKKGRDMGGGEGKEEAEKRGEVYVCMDSGREAKGKKGKKLQKQHRRNREEHGGWKRQHRRDNMVGGLRAGVVCI